MGYIQGRKPGTCLQVWQLLKRAVKRPAFCSPSAGYTQHTPSNRIAQVDLEFASAFERQLVTNEDTVLGLKTIFFFIVFNEKVLLGR